MTEKRLAALQGWVKDLLLEKEREGGGGGPVPEAQKESGQLEFLVANSQHKVRVPGLLVERGIREWEGSGA